MTDWYRPPLPQAGSMPEAGSPATGPLPLHPMSVGDILDGIFKLLKANFRTIAVVVGTLVVPFQVFAAFLRRDTLGGRSFFSVIRDPSVHSTSGSSANATATILTLGINTLLLPFVAAAIAKVVAASYVGGSIGPGEALRAAGRRAHTLLAAWITWHPIEWIGFVFCIFPGVAWMTMFVMVAPVVVIENISFWKALRRSWHLASTRYWATMGIALLAAIIASAIAQALSAGPTVVALAIGFRWGWLLIAVAGALSALIVTPIAAITATLLYFDARIRSEGFDLEVLAARLG